MEWTDLKISAPRQYADTVEAIATGISGGGIYIEDYADLEAQVQASRIVAMSFCEPRSWV